MKKNGGIVEVLWNVGVPKHPKFEPVCRQHAKRRGVECGNRQYSRGFGRYLMFAGFAGGWHAQARIPPYESTGMTRQTYTYTDLNPLGGRGSVPNTPRNGKRD